MLITDFEGLLTSVWKFHRDYFNRLKTFLLHIYDTYHVNLRGKNSTEVRLQNKFMQNKCLFKTLSFNEEKYRQMWRLNSSSKIFLNKWETMWSFLLANPLILIIFQRNLAHTFRRGWSSCAWGKKLTAFIFLN